MATEVFTNDATTTVTTGGTTAPAGGTVETWTVASSATFPGASTGAGTQFHVADPAAPTEKILVTNVSGATWTVTRGAEGSAPLAHAAGFTIRQVFTAGWLSSVLTGLQNYAGVFGDGSDGAVAFDGTSTFSFASTTGSAPNLAYTLTRDVFATSLAVSSGKTLNPNGFRIFCQGAFSNAGTIQYLGANATGAPGAAGPGGGTLQPPGSGATGTNGAGAQASTTNGAAGTGAGGAGGNGTSGAGGAARNPGWSTAFPFRLPSAALTGIPVGKTSAGAQVPAGGPGGSSGAGDGTTGGLGGGGGSGGGIVIILAWSASNTGTITVAGGNGGNGVLGTGAASGGGGGGGGGNIIVYTLSAWTAGTTNVSGGTGGSAAGTGTAGAAGSAGTVLNVIVQ